MYLLLLIFDVFVADTGAFPSNKILWCHLTSDVLMLLLAYEGMYVCTKFSRGKSSYVGS